MVHLAVPFPILMKAKQLVLAVLTVLATFTPIVSFAALPDNVVAQRRDACRSLGVDLVSRNECYYRLAIAADDVSICDEIRWAARSAACRRNILYDSPWDIAAIIPQSVLPIFIGLFILYALKKPPRSTFVWGSLIGCAIAGVVLFINWAEYEWLKVLSPYTVYVTLPTDGLISYSPIAFGNLPYAAQLIIAHAVLYGAMFGLILHGEKDGYKVAAMTFALALVFAFWHHPALSFIHSTIDILKS